MSSKEKELSENDYDLLHKMNMFLLGIYEESGLSVSSKNRTSIQNKALELAKAFSAEELKELKEKLDTVEKWANEEPYVYSADIKELIEPK